jgi:hypothetical protein
MTLDEERQIEQASLLPGRYYIVMRADEEDNFYITAYDTTDEKDETREYLETGEVILNGLMELVESDFERVGEAGLARISFHTTKEAILESMPDPENDEERASIEELPNSNIVKVTFGRKQ